MTTWIFLLIMLAAFPLLMPEAFLSWSQRTRRRLKERVRRRATPEQWEQIKHEFSDD